jgi:hypothetical protein
MYSFFQGITGFVGIGNWKMQNEQKIENIIYHNENLARAYYYAK